MRAPARQRRPYVRFTRWRRRHFFRVLEETGHVEMAAEAAGVSLACIYRLRRVEDGFSAKMDSARAAADVRLRAGDEMSPAGGAAGAFVIRKGIGGRVRMMAAGRRWWAGRHDALFLAHLRVTGNVTASAMAAGFSTKTAWNQRGKRADFGRAWDRAVDEAEVRLELRLIEAAAGTMGLPEPDEAAEAKPLDLWLAMWLLRRGERRRGSGSAGAPRASPKGGIDVPPGPRLI